MRKNVILSVDRKMGHQQEQSLRILSRLFKSLVMIIFPLLGLDSVVILNFHGLVKKKQMAAGTGQGGGNGDTLSLWFDMGIPTPHPTDWQTTDGEIVQALQLHLSILDHDEQTNRAGGVHTRITTH